MMNVLVIYSSPNKDGLTAACAKAAEEGVKVAGGHPETIPLNDLQVGMCEACEDGWGTCLEQHTCQTLDDFQELHTRIKQADAYIIVTPVYWGEPSESAKALLDRLRRCEATKGKESSLTNKPVIAIAAAGGSGGGMITCLASLERWIYHVNARIYDLIPLNRWSREYKLTAIASAAQTMVSKEQFASKENG
jgi:multimeric flavodoxin WrbA